MTVTRQLVTPECPKAVTNHKSFNPLITDTSVSTQWQLIVIQNKTFFFSQRVFFSVGGKRLLSKKVTQIDGCCDSTSGRMFLKSILLPFLSFFAVSRLFPVFASNYSDLVATIVIIAAKYSTATNIFKNAFDTICLC